MAGYANFFRYEDELVTIYRRFGEKPFFFREVADVVSKRIMSQLAHRGYLIVHKKGDSAREGILWQLPARIVDKCQDILDNEQEAEKCLFTVR